MSLPTGCAFVDGAYVPPSEAKISVFDWGFLHSDATYDVATVWQGSFFRLEDHIERFFASMKALRMDCGHTREQVREIMHECVRRAGLREAYVEILCTRGMPQPGSRDPRSCTNRFMAFAIPYVWIADPEKQRRGVNLIVSELQRIPGSSVDPRIKNYHWLDMVMGLFQAYDRGGETVVLQDGQGHVAEGPGFNVFAVKGREVWTPDAGVLEGITRRTVIEMVRSQLVPEGWAMRVEPLPVQVLRSADEVFLSSSGGGVVAIHALDGVPVGGRAAGEFGPVTRRLQERYWALHGEAALSDPVRY